MAEMGKGQECQEINEQLWCFFGVADSCSTYKFLGFLLLITTIDYLKLAR